MSVDNIEILYGGSWRKDETDFKKSVDNMVADIERLSKVAKTINIKFTTGSKADWKSAMDEARKAHMDLKNTIDLLVTAIKANNAAEQAQAKTREANSKATQAATKAEELSYKALREKNKMLRETAKEMERLEKARLREEAQLKKSQSAYQQLNTQYKTAADKAQNLGAEIELLKQKIGQTAGPGDTARLQKLEQEFTKTSAEAHKLHSTLLKIDETVGKSQRNVGNYKSQWNGLNFSIQQMVREVPSTINNLAMLPLALSNNVGTFIDALKQARVANEALKASGQATIPVWKQAAAAIFSWQTALMAGIAILVAYSSSSGQAAKKTGDFAEAMKSASGDYAEARVQLEAWGAALKDSSTSLEQKEMILKEYNATLGDHMGKQTSILGLEKRIVEAGPAYIEAMRLRAEMAAALAASTDILTQSMKDQANFGTDLLTTGDQVESFLMKLTGTGVYASTDAKNAKKRLDDAKKLDDTRLKNLEKIIVDRQAKLAALSKKMGFNFNPKEPKPKKGKEPTDLTNTIIEAERDINEALAAMREADVQSEMDRAKANSENERLSLEDRLDNYEYYLEKQRELQQITYEKELEDLNLQQDKILHKIDEANNSKEEKEKARLKAQEAYSLGLEALAAKYDMNSNDRLIKSEQEKRDIIESSTKEQIKAIMQGAQDIENAQKDIVNRELIRLNEEFELKKKHGVNWEREYQEQRKKIIEVGQEETVNASRAYFLTMLDEMQRAGKLTKEIADKIREELAKERPGKKSGKDRSIGFKLVESLFPEMSDDETQKIVDSYSQAFSSIYNGIKDAASARFEAQISNLETEMDMMQRKYELEKDYINATFKSEEEKKKALGDLAAVQTAKEIEQRRRINEVRRRQVQSEKQAAIMEVTAKTGIAIMEALGSLGPIAGAIAAVGIGIAGAAQIAAISSRPLPEFAKGGHHIGGPAVVGEKGAELFRDAVTGKVGITPDGPTVMNFKNPTDIITADETSRIMKLATMRPLDQRKQEKHVQDQVTAQVMSKAAKDIVKAIQGQKTHITVKNYDNSYRSKIIRH